jgi:hypothetical protein
MLIVLSMMIGCLPATQVSQNGQTARTTWVGALKLITAPTVSAVVGMKYFYDANYTPAGSYHFSLSTNCTWLNFDSYTGVINGTCPLGSSGKWYDARLTVISNTTSLIECGQNWSILCNQVNFSGIQIAQDYYWSMPHNNHTVEDGCGIYVVFNGGPVSGNLDQYIVKYDKNNRTWSHPVYISSAQLEWPAPTNDDHCEPTVYLDKEERIHVFVSSSATSGDPIQEYISVNPNDITSWQPAVFIWGARASYQEYPTVIKNPFNDTWYCFFLESQGGAMPEWQYCLSFDEGYTWTWPVVLTNLTNYLTEGKMYIFDFHLDERQPVTYPELIFAMTLATPLDGRKNVYLGILNLTDSNVYNDTGVKFGQSIGYELFPVFVVYDSGGYNINQLKIRQISDGMPVIFFQKTVPDATSTGEWNDQYYFQLFYMEHNAGDDFSAPQPIPYTVSKTYDGYSKTHTWSGTTGEIHYDIKIMSNEDWFIVYDNDSRDRDNWDYNFGGAIHCIILNKTLGQWIPFKQIANERTTQGDDLATSFYPWQMRAWGSPEFVSNNTGFDIIFGEWNYGVGGTGAQEPFGNHICLWNLNGFVTNGTDLSRGAPLIRGIPATVGTIGSTYSFQSYTTLPERGHYIWNLTGPSWLTILSSNDTGCILNGITNASGTYNYTLTVKWLELCTSDNYSWSIVVPSPTTPTCTISAPTSNPTMTTGWHMIYLRGTATDNIKVTSVTWSNSLGGSGIAYMTPQWGAANVIWQSRGNVMLYDGVNVITVTAYDNDGNSVSDTLTVTYNTAPTVTITAPTSNPTMITNWHMINLWGVASDDFRVVSVTWTNSLGGSGVAYLIPQWGSTVSWQSRGNINLLNGDNVITVTAYDNTGKTATDVLTVTYTGL